MAWERGYYYRIRRENGRVVREYMGRGRPAEAMATLDSLERQNGCQEARLDAEAMRNEKAKLDALDTGIEALIEATDVLACARGRRLPSAQAWGMEKTP